MLPDRVSNPGPLTYESGALPIALRGPASLIGYHLFIRAKWSKYPYHKSELATHWNITASFRIEFIDSCLYSPASLTVDFIYSFLYSPGLLIGLT